MIGRGLAFGFGYLVAIAACVSLNFAYRGAWLPFLLAIVLAYLFGTHPRLSRAPGSIAYVLTLGLFILAIWMLSAEPIPSPKIRPMAESLPTLFAFLGLICFLWFVVKNARAKPELSLFLPVALLLLIFAGVIANFSGGKGGADPMVNWASGFFGLSAEAAYIVIVAVRKGVHFFGYGLLAWMAYRLANPKFELRSAIIFGMTVALAFAIFDEVRQTSSAVRNGSAWDIGLDLAGAATVIGISVLRYRYQLKPNVHLPRSTE